jgi:hypothetical protein
MWGGILVIINDQGGVELSEHSSLFANCQTFGFFAHDLRPIQVSGSRMDIVHVHIRGWS